MTVDLQTMLDGQNNRCNLCEYKISYEIGNLHLDHIKPNIDYYGAQKVKLKG